MFTKSDIRRVSIVIPAERYSGLIVSLGKSALLHLDKGGPAESSVMRYGLRDGGLSSASDFAEMIISLAEEFIKEEAGDTDSAAEMVPFSDDISVLFQCNPCEDLREVRRITGRREKFEKSEAAIEKQIASLEKQLGELGKLSADSIDFSLLSRLKQVSFLYGSIKGDSFSAGMKDRWFYKSNENMLLVMFPPHDRDELLNILRNDGFSEYSGIQNREDVIQQSVEKRIALLRGRLDLLRSLYDSTRDKSMERLLYLRNVYRLILKISEAEQGLLSSDELVVVSGWMNVDDGETMKELLDESTAGNYYMRIAPSAENRLFRGKIPVLLKNTGLFRPFELLVRMMGTPGNSEVDPTPAAAIAYTIIFGVMFGDLGQGLILAASGLIISRYGEKKHGGRNSITDFGRIIIWCGLSAAVFGIFYGSVFSNEHLIPALLFHPMENMMELFLMAITAGVILISAGLFFNSINGLLAGHYEEALFGTKGVAGLAVYLTAVYSVMRYVLEGSIPGTMFLTAALLPPAILFLLRGPLGYLLFHGESVFPNGLFEYIVESMVEVMEMFSGLLGNTISFIRAGAFALSHAGLSIAVFTLAEIIDPSMKSAGAIAAIVAGNIFIILLEGLVCSIQSMRLEYYEFFGKFYRGDGVAFSPFSLRFR